MYHYRDYPCREEDQWDVLGQALAQNIPKLHQNILNDKKSSPDLVKRSEDLMVAITEIPTISKHIKKSQTQTQTPQES